MVLDVIIIIIIIRHKYDQYNTNTVYFECKTNMIPVIIGATGNISKSLRENT